MAIDARNPDLPANANRDNSRLVMLCECGASSNPSDHGGYWIIRIRG
jgi:hypothetical protein